MLKIGLIGAILLMQALLVTAMAPWSVIDNMCAFVPSPACNEDSMAGAAGIDVAPVKFKETKKLRARVVATLTMTTTLTTHRETPAALPTSLLDPVNPGIESSRSAESSRSLESARQASASAASIKNASRTQTSDDSTVSHPIPESSTDGPSGVNSGPGPVITDVGAPSTSTQGSASSTSASAPAASSSEPAGTPFPVVPVAVGVSIGIASATALGAFAFWFIRKRRRERFARAETPPPVPEELERANLPSLATDDYARYPQYGQRYQNHTRSNHNLDQIFSQYHEAPAPPPKGGRDWIRTGHDQVDKDWQKDFHLQDPYASGGNLTVRNPDPVVGVGPDGRTGSLGTRAVSGGEKPFELPG